LEEENTVEGLNLVQIQTQTQASAIGHEPTRLGRDVINFNLVKCTFLILKEQGHLWKWFIVLLVATLAGGIAHNRPSCFESFVNMTIGATFPAQAILFARIVEAFQLPANLAIHQGDFYSLMFFIVALGNLCVFAAVGWASNIVAQHVSRTYRREIFDLVLKQDMAFFDDEANASGALASNLSSYPSNLMELMGFNLMLILINVVNVLSSSILAIAVGWKLGLVVVFGGQYSFSLDISRR
jgi:ATP-binding cassette subfamily B (MDR/TAP) protein 1